MRANHACAVGLAILVAGAVTGGCRSASKRGNDEHMRADVDTGMVEKTITLDGEAYLYGVWVPEDYTPDQAWPIVLFLHGAGERGTDGIKQTQIGIGKFIRAYPERFPCIVVMPQCRPGKKWAHAMQDLALACLDAAEAEYNVDPARVTLTGLSLGGYGTWSIGAQYPERFCALAPVCGGGNPAMAEALARTPIWCWHGDADPVVPVDQSREMVVAVRVAGGDVQYTELPGVTHNSWDAAYGNPALIAWMLEQRRE